MKHFLIYLVLILEAILIASCEIFGTRSPQNLGLKGQHVTGLYSDGNYIIAGTEKGIFLSTDSGDNWILADSAIYLNNFLVPNNISPPSIRLTIWGDDSTIFAGIEGGESAGVLLSTDKGKTWRQKDTYFTEEINGGFTKIGNTIFVGTNHGVFFTTDAGSSWQAAADTNKMHPVFSLASIGTTLFAGIPNIGVFRSTDKGKTWAIVNHGLTNTSTLTLTTLSSKLYVGVRQAFDTANGGVFISNNNGENWNPLNNKLTSHTVNVLYSTNSTLFAGTNSGVYFSADQGSMWNLFDSVDASTFTSNDSYLFIGTNNGVKRYPLSQF